MTNDDDPDLLDREQLAAVLRRVFPGHASDLYGHIAGKITEQVEAMANCLMEEDAA